MTKSASPLSVGGEHGNYISQASNLLRNVSNQKTKIMDIRLEKEDNNMQCMGFVNVILGAG